MDIVEQLRKSANTIYSQDGYTFRLGLHNEAADEIERLRNGAVMTEWQPIENAPIDGTIVLIQRDGSQVVAFQEDGIWHCDLYGYELLDQDRITHWMPLPEEPK